MNTQNTCEKRYQQTGARFQVRTNGGRLVAESQHVDGCEFRVAEGRNRTLWHRVDDFSRAVWLAR